MSKKYIAIIGDIKGSRKIINREEFQKKFKQAMEKINQKYKEFIESNFTISSGDEFQALLCFGNKTFEIIFDIELMLYPYSARFGIGYGDVNTKINRENSLEIDGPCYHFAREMIEKVKESEKTGKIQSNYYMKMNGDLTLVNSICEFLSLVRNSWSDKQINTIKTFRNAGFNQAKTSLCLNIGQSSVSRSLSSSKYYLFSKGIENLDNYIGEIDE
ncbi:MAG: SatD family protein [Tissierellia bacterium]|nr:SatD family protein [Tissierellia bacterium]